jgi:hypothetical protein
VPKLTDSQFNQAKELLNGYNAGFMQTKQLDTRKMEKELCEVWGLTYLAIRDMMKDLFKKDEYRLLAARYMENGVPSVPFTFKPILAKLYGMTIYDSRDREEKQREFWASAFPAPAA